MPRLTIASTLAKWVPLTVGALQLELPSQSLRSALEQAFVEFPTLRSYVLDDQGALRHHLAIFVDGVAVRDKVHLQLQLPEQAEVFLTQSLSGG